MKFIRLFSLNIAAEEPPLENEPNKEVQLKRFRHSIQKLDGFINSGGLRSKFIFAALRGSAKNFECIFNLEIGSPAERRDYLDNATV